MIQYYRQKLTEYIIHNVVNEKAEISSQNISHTLCSKIFCWIGFIAGLIFFTLFCMICIYGTFNNSSIIIQKLLHLGCFHKSLFNAIYSLLISICMPVMTIPDMIIELSDHITYLIYLSKK